MRLQWIAIACLTVSAAASSLAADLPEDPPQKTQSWKQEAERSLLLLDATLKGMPETRHEVDKDSRASSPEPADYDLIAAKMADTLLVDLWFQTGSPAQIRRRGETTRDFIERNVRHYRAFLDKHAGASDEQITRLGLEAALDAMESEHLNVARRYFLKKWCGARLITANRGFDVLFDERVAGAFTPSESDRRAAAIYRDWYRENKSRLRWNSGRRLLEGGNEEALFGRLNEEYERARKSLEETRNGGTIETRPDAECRGVPSPVGCIHMENVFPARLYRSFRAC